MPGLKTNEVPGTRAVLRHYRMSAYKARQVLDLIRGKDVDRAEEILRATPREAAQVVAKVLGSAVSNARNNDLLDPEELYVSACFADEGSTMKRWRPRARGRATRIRKRSCHITVIVSRLPDDRLERRRARSERGAALRSRRVAASRRAEDTVVDVAPEEIEALEPTDVVDEGAVLEEADEADELAEEPEAEELAEGDDVAQDQDLAEETDEVEVEAAGAIEEAEEAEAAEAEDVEDLEVAAEQEETVEGEEGEDVAEAAAADGAADEEKSPRPKRTGLRRRSKRSEETD